MPNHVSNKIIIHSENSAEIIQFVKSDQREFDFNTIIKMPESLGIDEGSEKDAAFVYVATDGFNKDLSDPFDHSHFFKTVLNQFSSWDSEVINSKNWFERIKEDEEKLNAFIDLGKKAFENYTQYGCSSWYQWCIQNWGTKWNAYKVTVSKNTIMFDTAWNSPLPVIDALIAKFNLTCTYKAFDEGGWFWFIKEYENGVLVQNRDTLPEDEAVLQQELKGWSLEDEVEA